MCAGTGFCVALVVVPGVALVAGAAARTLHTRNHRFLWPAHPHAPSAPVTTGANGGKGCGHGEERARSAQKGADLEELPPDSRNLASCTLRFFRVVCCFYRVVCCFYRVACCCFST